MNKQTGGVSPPQQSALNPQARIFALLPGDFVLSRRKKGDIVLLIDSARERRCALVTTEEAAPFVEKLRPPGEALEELRRDPEEINGGQTGFFWIVASLEEGAAYFTMNLVVETFEQRRDRAIALLNEALSKSPLLAPLPPNSFFVCTLFGARKTFAVADEQAAMNFAMQWGLPIDKLRESPGTEPGMRRVWVLANLDGNALYFWFNIVQINETKN